MPQQRKFDWDRAVALFDDGWTVVDIAAEMEVSPTAVWRIIDPDLMERMNARARAVAKGGIACDNCGRPRSSNPTQIRRAREAGKLLLCKPCRDIEAVTSVRLVRDEDGLWWPQLRCRDCREWKWMTDFTRGKQAGRFFRKGTCRSCDTAARRKHRNRTKVPCVICGKLRLSDNEKVGHLKRGKAVRLWPFCQRCLHHSDDPRAVRARKAIRDLQQATLTAGARPQHVLASAHGEEQARVRPEQPGQAA